MMLNTVWLVDRYLNFDLNFLLIRIDSEIPFSKNLHHTETNQRYPLTGYLTMRL